MKRHEKTSHVFRTGCWLALSVLLIGAHSGCVSSSYKSARKNVPPAVLLNLNATSAPTETAAQPATEISLNSVVIHQSPGSWKRSAYWDEYVLTLANRGDAAMTIDSAMLTDFQGAVVSPGTNPWALEGESRSYAARFLTGTGTALKIGSGAVVTTAGGILGGAGVASGGGYFAALGGAAVGAVVVLPVFVGATIYRNVSGKHHIEEQFRARRLTLPLALAPGAVAHGSLFFRITPAPQRLTLQSTAADGASATSVIQLAPLAGLHLSAPPDSLKKF